jgi:hypothetical protein
MPIVDKNKVAGMIKAGQSLAKLESAATDTSGDWIGKIERIINGINDMAVNFQKLKSGDPDNRADQLNSGRRAIPESHRIADQRSPSEDAKPEHTVETAGKGDEPMNKFGKTLIGILSDYMDKCIAENPNMTIGEAIAKAPLNVTQVRGLLELAKTVL